MSAMCQMRARCVSAVCPIGVRWVPYGCYMCVRWVSDGHNNSLGIRFMDGDGVGVGVVVRVKVEGSVTVRCDVVTRGHTWEVNRIR